MYIITRIRLTITEWSISGMVDSTYCTHITSFIFVIFRLEQMVSTIICIITQIRNTRHKMLKQFPQGQAMSIKHKINSLFINGMLL